jgi:hypothetical protein
MNSDFDYKTILFVNKYSRYDIYKSIVDYEKYKRYLDFKIKNIKYNINNLDNNMYSYNYINNTVNTLLYQYNINEFNTMDLKKYFNDYNEDTINKSIELFETDTKIRKCSTYLNNILYNHYTNNGINNIDCSICYNEINKNNFIGFLECGHYCCSNCHNKLNICHYCKN